MTNPVLAELKAQNAGARDITQVIDRLEASQNILRLAREELTAKGETPRYIALLDAARDEIKAVRL